MRLPGPIRSGRCVSRPLWWRAGGDGHGRQPSICDFGGTSTAGKSTMNPALGEAGANAASPNDGTVVRWRMAGSYLRRPLSAGCPEAGTGDEKFEAVLRQSQDARPSAPGLADIPHLASDPGRRHDRRLNNEPPAASPAMPYAPGSANSTYSCQNFPGGPAQKRRLESRPMPSWGSTPMSNTRPPVVGLRPASGRRLPTASSPASSGKKLKAVKKG